jgi:hypothetical protein
MRPEEIELKQNGLSTKWEDIEDLVAKGVLLTTKGTSLEDGGPDFRQDFADAKATNEQLGAAIRWTLQGRRGGGLRLVLQALPTSALSLLRRAEYVADDTPAIDLDSTRILYQQEPRHLGSGPTPSHFARDPAAAMENLSTHPDNIREGWSHTPPSPHFLFEYILH